MCLSIAITAARQGMLHTMKSFISLLCSLKILFFLQKGLIYFSDIGSAIANHVKVTDLVKNKAGKIVGAKMRDELTGEEWVTKSKCVVNATGPFTGRFAE